MIVYSMVVIVKCFCVLFIACVGCVCGLYVCLVFLLCLLVVCVYCLLHVLLSYVFIGVCRRGIRCDYDLSAIVYSCVD